MSSRKISKFNSLTKNSSPVAESLEPRLMLDGSGGFSADDFTTDIVKKYTFNDENNNAITIKLSYATATLTTSEDGYGDIIALDVFPTSSKASVTISSKYDINIEDITVYGSIKTLSAKKLDLEGDLEVQGWAQKIILSDVADGSQIQIYTDGAIELDPKKKLSLTIDDAVNCDFSSGLLPVSKFYADSFTGGSVTANLFSSIISSGVFSADITALDADSKNISISKFSAGIADGTTINAPAAIKSIKVQDWTDGSVTADSISSLVVGNKRNPADFTADITLAGNLVAEGKPTLSKIAVTGQSRNATWDIDGYIKSISAGQIDSLTISSVDVLKSFKATDIDGLSMTVDESAGKITANSIANAAINAESATSITVKTNLSDSDFDFSLPTQEKGYTFGNLTVKGSITDTTLSSSGKVSKISAANMDNFDIDSVSAVSITSKGNLSDSELVFSLPMPEKGYTFGKLTVKGDITDSVLDSSGNISTITATNISNFDLDAVSASTIVVKNDLSESDFDFSLPLQEKGYTLKKFYVASDMSNSTLRSQGSVSAISAARITDSAILVGVDSGWETDDDSDGVIDMATDPASYNAPVNDQYAKINSITVKGKKSITDNLLSNTNISAAAINKAYFANVDTDNDGEGFFGVVFKDYITKLSYKQNNRTYTLGKSNWPDTGWFVAADVDENYAPKVTADFISTNEDTATVSSNVLANDADLNGDSFDVVSYTQASNGTVNYTSNGIFAYTPNADFNGLDSFTYTIEDDGGAQTTGTISVTVSALNDAPRPENDSYSTDEDNAITITDVLDNDTDIDSDTFGIVAFSQATNGTVARSGSTFTYTPDANYFGTDSFTYTVRDSEGLSAAATVTITVISDNDAPVAVDDGYSVDEDNALTTGDVTANDTDAEGDAFSITSYTNPSHGSLTDNGDGTFDYTPQADFNGSDSFTYTIEDGDGQNSTATVTITVNAVNDAPTAVDDEDFTTTNNARTTDNVLANDSDVDGDQLTVQSYTNPANGSVIYNDDGTFTYTPNLGYTGTDTFTYTADDGNGGTDTATVTITINQAANNNPQAIDDSFIVAVNQDYTTTNVLDNDTDSDGHTLTITDFTQPTHGSVTYNDDGTFTYSLAEEDIFAGDDVFTYTISDGFGGTDTATITITKPRITLDPMGAPDLDGVEVDSLRVYRLRATAQDGEDAFDTFIVDSLSGVHNIWLDGATQTLHGPTSMIPEDLQDFDTHMLFIPLFNLAGAETNDASNPTGNDFDGATAGIGTFSSDDNINSTLQTRQFFQLVLPSTTSLTLTGETYQGIGGDKIEFSFEIEAVEDPDPSNAPSASDDTFNNIVSNAPYTTDNVLANDTDPNSDALTITDYTQPSHGTVVYNDDGTFTYTLSEYFYGDDTFEYTISDGNGGTDTATITINKPRITLDPLGSPVLDGVEIDSLQVYRIRATALLGEDTFETFSIDTLTGVHQIWADDTTQTIYNTMTGIDADLEDFDTHMLFSPFMSLNNNETNDGSNPTSSDFGTARAGLGTFEADEDIINSELSIQFFQIVLPSTTNLTVTGGAYQGLTEREINISITAVDNSGPNTAPEAIDDSFTVAVNQDYTTTNVLDNDTDSDGHTLTITDFTQPTHGSVTYNDDGTFTYSLAEEDIFAGDDVFTYTISDGFGGTDTATITITKPRITLDPMGAPDLDGVEVDSLRVYRLRATAQDGEDAFETFVVDNLSGVHNLWLDGSTQTIYGPMSMIPEDLQDFDTHMMFIPGFALAANETNDASNPTGNDFDGATAGIGTFTAECDLNSTLQSRQFFQLVLPSTTSLTVTGEAYQDITEKSEFSFEIEAAYNPANNAPVAVDDSSGNVESNAPFTTENVLANDTDADSDSLTITSYTQPSHGTVVYNSDGTFTYTLSEYFTGDDTFEYTISDGNGGTDTGTYTITKPKITYDVIGSPSLDGTEVPGLTVYRLRCTADDGEDLFDSFVINPTENTHQVWGNAGAQTIRLDPGVIDDDWLDFDTHMMISSANSPLSIDLSETNDGSNPSGLTFNNGTIAGTAGMGSFEAGAVAVSVVVEQSYQFMQIVIKNTDTVTISGLAAQVTPDAVSTFDITLE